MTNQPLPDEIETLRGKIKRGTWDIDYVCDHWLPARLKEYGLECRKNEARIIHRNIDAKFNLIERIQDSYNGDKTINVNRLQDLLCDHHDRLATLSKQQEAQDD